MRFLRRHVVFDNEAHLPLDQRLESGGELTLTSAAGHPVTIKKEQDRLEVNGIEVMSDIRPTGTHAVYEISGILDDELEWDDNSRGIPPIDAEAERKQAVT